MLNYIMCYQFLQTDDDGKEYMQSEYKRFKDLEEMEEYILKYIGDVMEIVSIFHIDREYELVEVKPVAKYKIVEV